MALEPDGAANQPLEAQPLPWELDGPMFERWSRTGLQAVSSTRTTFERLPDGSVGSALNFAFGCRLVPAAIQPLLAPKDGIVATLLSVFIGALIKAALSMFLLGTVHYVVTRLFTGHASWTLSTRAVAFTQALMLPPCLLVLALSSLPSLYDYDAALRSGGSLIAAIWMSMALFWLGKGRLRLSLSKAACAAIIPSFGVVLLFRVLS